MASGANAAGPGLSPPAPGSVCGPAPGTRSRRGWPGPALRADVHGLTSINVHVVTQHSLGKERFFIKTASWSLFSTSVCACVCSLCPKDVVCRQVLQTFLLKGGSAGLHPWDETTGAVQAGAAFPCLSLAVYVTLWSSNGARRQEAKCPAISSPAADRALFKMPPLRASVVIK